MSNQATGTEAAVCADIAERQRLGIAKYGTTVADNPLTLEQWLTHAYEECLDQAVYLKRCIAEVNNGTKVIKKSLTTEPLRDGEVRMRPENGHNDVRNDGDLCFGHPGLTWCETCGATYGTAKWLDGCISEFDKRNRLCERPKSE
jgi:hypothetical protein